MALNPYQKYQQQSVMTMTPGEMLTRLFDELIKQLSAFKEYNSQKDYAQANGIRAEITAVWYGMDENRVLLWEEGMDLPAASAADEAEWGFDASSAAYWEAHYGPLEAAS